MEKNLLDFVAETKQLLSPDVKSTGNLDKVLLALAAKSFALGYQEGKSDGFGEGYEKASEELYG